VLDILHLYTMSDRKSSGNADGLRDIFRVSLLLIPSSDFLNPLQLILRYRGHRFLHL